MTMTCDELEARLEDLVGGALAGGERDACDAHLRGCERCAALVELATVPAPGGEERAAAGPELTASVLALTSGPACGRAQPLLVAGRDEAPAPGDEQLLGLHLEHCASCRALARALAALARDLPALAELEPGAGFVARVLAATLPAGVRLRRWRRRRWAGWVQRPRFAMEAAYALTALLVVLFNVPGTPLTAMPRQAVELARAAPLGELDQALEQPVRQGIAAWSESPAGRRAAASWAHAGELRGRLPQLADETAAAIRTFLGDVASWLEKGSEDGSSPQAESTEETS